MLRAHSMQAAGPSGSSQPGINGLSGMSGLPAVRPRRRCLAIARAGVDPPRAVAAPPATAAAELRLRNWAIDSWRQYDALQQPVYPDAEEHRRAVEEIKRMPPLVFAGECRTLQAKLAQAAAGEAFVLQGGDCAEAFADLNANRIRDTYRVLLQMSVVLTFGGGMPVVKMGRMAGQFAKPRSAPTETIDGVELPSYRGDIINGAAFDAKSRVPDPWRLLKAYNHCASTLNLLRGFSSGGYAALHRVTEWSLDFMRATENGHAYIDLAERVKEAITFMVACGLDLNTPLMKETDFFTCHEALLLDYEEALTREDSTTSLAYDTSSHFLWCGERTRNLDGAHVEFLRGVANPIGVKVSNKAEPSELVSLIATLNPLNTPGRIAVVTRMGADKLKKHLPAFISAVKNSGQVVTWICDPMHGNTESVNGFKTRRFENIQKEVETFFDVHETMGSTPGGIHLEMTGDNVTECMGGGAQISEDDLNSRYHTHCDPRLNAEQALELAFYAASRLRSRKNKLQSVSSNGIRPLPSL
ncbi:unnamed protein product [Ostreobium quekettii]|uniref:Phospho-2-dehydro-3-deoxyheptonate aldolase n=1 Tax=Ostreobium quekettii TaxID=121088 RepID=A0A8S1IZN8_9CHLO|nr:unnamed protein product [Ostreobium quekettii]|eukprot:evm.model.scf_199.11 EVM.evm.TU.scf_199.11   scf_199:86676-90090(+)